jgi:iron complex outermembrane receptor protein
MDLQVEEVGTDELHTSICYRKDEVLRDGASAQYGSDAIAGYQHQHEKKTLINLDKPLFGGSHFSKDANDHTEENDGNNIQIDFWNKFRKEKKFH